MASKFACVLDFGSSKISVMIGGRGVNNTFNVVGIGETEYAGFYEGEFVEREALPSVIASSIEKAETNSGIKVDKLYVGVPAEFSYCFCSEASISFSKQSKVSNSIVLDLFNQATKNVDIKDNVIINRSPISFLLDDNRKVINPIGLNTTKLTANVSFVLAENSFINFIDDILKNIHINQIEYMSNVLSEALYLLDPEIRDTGAILIDCGYITSSVAFVKGDGLIGLNAFSVGGGHISADLCQVLQLTFSQAESLKRKVVLSLDATDSDYYEINVDNTVTPVSAKLTNDIVMARLDVIAELINKCLISFKSSYSGYMPIYLTGGGLCYLKGGKDYLSKCIASNIEILSAPIPQLNRPHYSSVLGLLDLALKQEKLNGENIFQKIKKWFSK